MKAKLFGKTLVVTLSRGEKLVECLKSACAANSVETGSVSGIGSVLNAELQSYRAETASYADFSISEPCEIVSPKKAAISTLISILPLPAPTALCAAAI